MGRVLVVDDIEANRDLISRRVQRLGHDIDQAADGTEALAMLRSVPYDVVLLDVMMPGLNGYQVLESIKGDSELADVRVIMVSAVDEIDSVVRCIELGADDYLAKPFNSTLLTARLQSSLARKHVQDAQRAHAQSLERELEIGREIQQGFFPDQLPDIDGWLLDAHFASARQVSGDFYDVFSLATDRLAIVVGDVCDKGVGAALYMALFRTLVRSHAVDLASPSGTEPGGRVIATVSATNHYIATVHGQANMFATLLVGVLNTVSGDFDFVNAGHDAPLIRRSDGTIEELSQTGPAVGLLADLKFGSGHVNIGVGDALIAFTDGVTEAVGPDGVFLGDARLRAIIEQAADGTIARHIGRAVDEFVAGDAPTDDVTVLSVLRQVV